MTNAFDPCVRFSSRSVQRQRLHAQKARLAYYPLSLPRLLERLFMQIPLQISFENAEPSEAVRVAIEHEVERLEKYHHHIIGCRVAVVAPSTKHRHGAVSYQHLGDDSAPREHRGQPPTFR
jgi:hypothetical protein